MTGIPDAVVNAAVEAFARKRNPKHNTLDHSETLAIRAALAAASGPWAEQLDAEVTELRAAMQTLWQTVGERDTELSALGGYGADVTLAVGRLLKQRDAALARNAESYEDGYNQGHADAHADGAAPDRLCALRAELDNLRERVNAWEEAGYDLWRPYGDDCETCGTQSDASIVRPTVILDGSLTPVRGSDDEA